MYLLDTKVDYLEDLDDPAAVYIDIVKQLVKYSETQHKGIKIHQCSKVNKLRVQIRQIELNKW